MYVSTRQKMYLQIFMDRPDYITSEELAKGTGVTGRTVKSDIKKLNELIREWNARIDAKAGSGYRLTSCAGGAIHQLDSLLDEMKYERLRRLPDSRQERVEYIARKMLAIDYYVTMEELRQKLYVSRSTLNQDMKQVRRLFSLYELKVIHASHKGMRLKGTEAALRRCMRDLFFGDSKLYLTDSLGKLGGQNQEMIAEIQKKLVVAADKAGVCYAESAITELAVQIFIGAQRCRFLKYVEYNQNIQVSQDFMDMASQFSDSLVQLLGIQIPESEIHNIAVMFQFRSLLKELPTENQRFQKAVSLMFDAVREKYGLQLDGQEELARHLNLHLPLMAERCRNHILIENPILHDIFCNYPISVDVTNTAVKVLENYLDIRLNSNEFGYLAMYFNMCLMTYAKEKKKTLLLFSPGSRVEAAMYYKELFSIFGKVASLISISQQDELRNMEFTGNEVVVSTTSLPFLPGFVKMVLIKCNVYSCFSEIMAALTSLPQGAFNIDEFMDESMWKVHVNVNTPGNYYQFLFDHLCDIQMMDFGEAQTLYDNIAPFGQELGNQVVFIRSENRFLNPFVHVTITREPFLWKSQYVRVLLFANLSDGNLEFRSSLYAYLSNWYGQKEKVDEIIRNPVFHDVMDFVRI